MPPRALRIRTLITGLAALLIAVVTAVTAVSAADAAANGSAHRRELLQCAKLLVGVGKGSARAQPGSADPQLAAELSILRAARTPRDTLPAASNLGRALKEAEATTYDPSASVRLDPGTTKAGAVYAVPVTLTAPPVPARCAHLLGLALLRGLIALKQEETGTGPGICLINAPLLRTGPPRSILPGKRPPGKAVSRRVATAGCESLAVMASYLGTFGGGLSGVGSPLVLVPDGVSALTYTFSDGHQLTAPVTQNVATFSPARKSIKRPPKVTRATLTREFNTLTPVTVTEQDAAGAAVATYPRLPSLVPLLVRDALGFERSRATSGTTTQSFGSEQVFASCSARTHRCVAAVVSTSCNAAHRRCKLSRRIARYRYVGRRPPRGTTGKVVVPTAPIRARVSRYVTRPGRLTLALSGAPHHRVDVLVASSCFSRSGGTGSGVGGPPLRLSVPSRTPVATVRRHRACDVNVLVMSSQRGPIQARLARG